jgi:hypothetical protein
VFEVFLVLTQQLSCAKMSALYRGVISVADKFVPAKLQPLWAHPAGKISF